MTFAEFYNPLHRRFTPERDRIPNNLTIALGLGTIAWWRDWRVQGVGVQRRD